MLCAVLKHWHPVMGVDFHIPWPPGSPAPAPTPAPYKTASIMAGTGLTSKMATTHNQQGFGLTMQVPTDVGPMIPHMGPPSQTLPIDIAFSSSKSYFGPTSTESQNERIAAALAGHLNPNLDCGLPIPTPTGMVLALTTVYTNMTLADVMFGFNAMAIDFCVQSILNALGNQMGNAMGPYLGYMFGRFAPRMMTKAAAKALLRSRGGVPENIINQAARNLARSRNQAAADFFTALPARTGNAANAIIGFFGGGPMGADAGTLGMPTPGGALGNAAQNYLNGPGPENHGGGG
ncbi:MAG TPA: hypothetical protein PLR71_06170 [Deltaproteobacteria bacterium]|nr:hypothetical protein [Deltaproteobacteria bacterium]HQI81132.1 hypothetical protein [Deltaproteobacteria bacterium]